MMGMVALSPVCQDDFTVVEDGEYFFDGSRNEDVPQRLKPQSHCVIYGIHSTALRTGSEAVPLSKTGVFGCPQSNTKSMIFFRSSSDALPEKRIYSSTTRRDGVRIRLGRTRSWSIRNEERTDNEKAIDERNSRCVFAFCIGRSACAS
jgi:hypothetical protein